MAPQNYRVRLARRADEMLLSHTEFLAQVSPAAACRLLADFRKTTKLLADTPCMFPFADELDVPGIPPETYRKCVFDRRYKAIYIVEDDTVYIDAVIDCRQENTNLYQGDS
ncbi:MAG: type II toxin-antitoxin system RelE/ParE family toxin [Clostridiales Family XIII bacterium]|jgi:plasmid stabilization system protein ParE|nr:type II toxin-antitoxin system RelE/ParE family toxin [Clostridiales Family XIII bacterium]